MIEIDLQQLLEDLLKGGENEFVEFKKNDYDQEKIGKYFSALSNGACLRNKDFGYLVYGIHDETLEVLGTNRNFKNEENRNPLELHLRNYIEPSIKFEIHEFYYQEKPIVLFKFSAARGTPTTYKKIPWARIQSHNVNLNEHQYSDLLRKICNSNIDWSAQIIKEATFEDLDPEAVKKACKKIKEKSKNLSNQNNPKILLDKARITVDGKITRTALILLGKPESAHFLSPSQAEILHKLVGWSLAPNEVTSKYFHPPFLLTLNDVWKEIRNNKIKIFASTNLLPDIVDKYDEEPILEILNNCIAHQDYTENKRIVFYERPDLLVFESAGNFFEGKVEDYIEGAKAPKEYRNKFLSDAMRELGMIDIEGSGINKIYLSQRKKFFPSPDYKTDNNEVSVTIYGKIINENFSKILMEQLGLDLTSVVLLDHVQKVIKITDEAAKFLKKKKLIEGRKPNYFITAEVASITNQEEQYLKNKGANNNQLKDWILSHLNSFKKVSRPQIDNILEKFLAEQLSEKQKKKKITNLLQEMSKKDKTIKNIGTNRKPEWIKTLGKL